MRISDWSSDVCSSDLRRQAPRHEHRGEDHEDDEGEVLAQHGQTVAPVGTAVPLRTASAWARLVSRMRSRWWRTQHSRPNISEDPMVIIAEGNRLSPMSRIMTEEMTGSSGVDRKGTRLNSSH